MKTMPLKEAMKLASKRPLHASKDTIHEKTGIAISQCFQRGTETPDPNVNAALLAHFYNHGPELVKTVADLIQSNEALHAALKVDASTNLTLLEARILLAKASTVQMP